MDQWRLDEGGAGVSRGALERTDPFARDRVNEICARERVCEMLWFDQGSRQQTVDCGSDPTAPRWDENEPRSVRADGDGSRRRREGFARHPGPWPSARSSRSSARANSSEPPTVERSFFAMTTRTPEG